MSFKSSSSITLIHLILIFKFNQSIIIPTHCCYYFLFYHYLHLIYQLQSINDAILHLLLENYLMMSFLSPFALLLPLSLPFSCAFDLPLRFVAFFALVFLIFVLLLVLQIFSLVRGIAGII